MHDRKPDRDERRALKERYRRAFARLTELLLEADPALLDFGFNTNEYDPEAGTILPRLLECESPDAVRAVVRGELVRWFGELVPESPAAYEALAERVWAQVVPILRGDADA